jgi:pilus assembly protein Flp/PilA
MKKLMKFFKDEEGVTAIEYGLIAFLIAIAVVATVLLVGLRLEVIFNCVLNALS